MAFENCQAKVDVVVLMAARGLSLELGQPQQILFAPELLHVAAGFLDQEVDPLGQLGVRGVPVQFIAPGLFRKHLNLDVSSAGEFPHGHASPSVQVEVAAVLHRHTGRAHKGVDPHPRFASGVDQGEVNENAPLFGPQSLRGQPSGP